MGWLLDIMEIAERVKFKCTQCGNETVDFMTHNEAPYLRCQNCGAMTQINMEDIKSPTPLNAPKPINLHYAGAVTGAFGWAVAGKNLTRELSKHVQLCNPEDADVVFTPIADHALNPATIARGKKLTISYCFFESELDPEATHRAQQYDLIFAGSTWCLNRLTERGITNAALLIQGVDTAIFNPQPPRVLDGKFRIFSGGKFEYRKGHDLVIKSFAEYSKLDPTAHLVCAWFNPWPHLFGGMWLDADLINRPSKQSWKNQTEFFQDVLESNGIARHQYTILPEMNQAALAKCMANTDVGLFPNRCEGGTNLVLMEYAHMGRRTISNVMTGHADVTDLIDYQIFAKSDANGWAVQNVEDLKEMLAIEKQEVARTCFNTLIPIYSWKLAAGIVLQQIRKLLKAKA